MTRRHFLRSAAIGPWLINFRARAAVETGRHKIRDIQVMILQGPRTYAYVKLSTGTGVFGIGEAYGSPGAGVKDQVLQLRPLLLGGDPLEIETLYNRLGRHTEGSAHMLIHGVSGIEMALCDLAGKILEVPVSALLGGRYRDKVRVYNHGGTKDPLDKSSCRDWAA